MAGPAIRAIRFHVPGSQPDYSPPARLETDEPSIFLELLTPGDAAAKLELEQANADHLAIYNMGSKLSNEEEMHKHLLALRGLARQGLLAHYKMIHSGRYVGELGLTRIGRRDPSPWVYYFIEEASQGRRIAKRAVSRLVRFAFEDWEVQEVRAGIRPSNEPSQRLAARVGFEPTGLPAMLLSRAADREATSEGQDGPLLWRLTV